MSGEESFHDRYLAERRKDPEFESIFARWYGRLSKTAGREPPFIRVENGRVVASSLPDGEMPDGYYVKYEGI
jgi:hypothetical protein